MFYKIAGLGLVMLLGACGGGSAEMDSSVSQIQAQNLRYGQTATLRIGGKYLRYDMVATTGSCTNPVFTAASTPDVAVLTCKVTATGAVPITIKAADGVVLYAGSLSVPQPQVTLLTSLGTVVIELDPAVAPLAVNNFLSYVGSGYYAKTLFHRVIPGFVVQGGGYTAGLVKKPGQQAPIALESNRGLLNTRSTVATGMDVVDAIAGKPTATVNGTADVPTADITISLAIQNR